MTDTMANKIITIFGNGLADNTGRKLVLNRKQFPNYERVLEHVNDVIPLPGGVRKLYTLPDCKLVRSLDMLASVGNTEFVAVGKMSLDRSKLPHLRRGKSASGEARKRSRKNRPPQGGQQTLGKHKQPLPGIESNSPDTSSAPRTPKGSGGQDALPDIAPSTETSNITDTDELQSSSRLLKERQPLPPVGSGGDGGDAAAGEAYGEAAVSIMNDADGVDRVHGSERERQRRAHQQRIATRQVARQHNHARTVASYTDGAEAVDTKVDTERTRQREKFMRRLSTRTRTAEMTSTSARSSTMSKEQAATKIQATFRGHKTRLNLAKGSSKSKKGSKDRKRRKSKSPARKSKAADSDGAAAAAQPIANSGKAMTARELLKVERIPTPDLTVSADEMLAVQHQAAAKIQARYRGFRTRKEMIGQTPLRDARLQQAKANAQQEANAKQEANAEAARAQKEKLGVGEKEKRHRRDGEKSGRRKKKGHRKKKSSEKDSSRDKTPDGETKATKLERQGSRFSTKGIEDKRVVEEQYEVGKKIGDGNFAEVKECVHRKTGKKYALKIIDKSKTRGAKETKMIENEVRTMQVIRHPNCVALYDVFDTEDELFLVMELVEGGDLFDRIVEKGKYAESDAVRLVRNMATAIQHLHSKNIIHRDLKPENLLVTKDKMGRDTIKLADFGLSMVVSEPLHTICGTPTYVAPEIIADGPEGYGLQVDLWATGVIAYIMLCGFPPFASQSKNQKDLFRKIRRGHFSFPEPYWQGVSDEAKDLISKLLQVNPQDRYTADQILSHPWIAADPQPSVSL